MKYNNVEISVKLFEKKFNGHRICDMSVMFRNYLLDFIYIYMTWKKSIINSTS